MKLFEENRLEAAPSKGKAHSGPDTKKTPNSHALFPSITT